MQGFIGYHEEALGWHGEVVERREKEGREKAVELEQAIDEREHALDQDPSLKSVLTGLKQG